MSPVPYTWGHFWPKFFSKSTKLKLDPLPPPRIISIHYLYWLLTRVYRKVGKKNDSFEDKAVVFRPDKKIYIAGTKRKKYEVIV